MHGGDSTVAKPGTATGRSSDPGFDRLADVWRALASVVDPEIPIVSVVELGIVRGVRRDGDHLLITVTPTYSGCPATRVIENDIRAAVKESIGEEPKVLTALAPPWTTDWIAPEALRKLHDAGIAPPGSAAPVGPMTINVVRRATHVQCPRCGSHRTSELARFGSTPCKAQYRCVDCLEPFDYFKPH